MDNESPDAAVARLIVVTFARGLVVLITALALAIVLLNRELMTVHWPIVVVPS